MENSILTTNKRTITEQGKLLFTIRQTADILSISTKSVRRLMERGLLKSNPALRTKLIHRDVIETFAKTTT